MISSKLESLILMHVAKNFNLTIYAIQKLTGIGLKYLRTLVNDLIKNGYLVKSDFKFGKSDLLACSKKALKMIDKGEWKANTFGIVQFRHSLAIIDLLIDILNKGNPISPDDYLTERDFKSIYHNESSKLAPDLIFKDNWYEVELTFSAKKVYLDYFKKLSSKTSLFDKLYFYCADTCYNYLSELVASSKFKLEFRSLVGKIEILKL